MGKKQEHAVQSRKESSSEHRVRNGSSHAPNQQIVESIHERDEPATSTIDIEVNAKQKQLSVKNENPKKWAHRNIYGLSIAFVVLFSAFIGLQNLQSSINASGGLGTASLTVLYSTFIISGFTTPSFIKLFGTKYSLLFGFVCHLIYTITNFHPSWYTLMPGSIIIGFASSPMWAAASAHIIKVAIHVAPLLRKNQDIIINKFTGTFFFFFQFNQLPGNLASSLILYPYGQNKNMSKLLSGPLLNLSSVEVCNHSETASMDSVYLYVLVSIYTLFVISGILILLLTVDHLPSDTHFFSAERKFHLYLEKPFISLLQVFKDWKMLLLAPMAVFNGMEMGFAFGSFTEVYEQMNTAIRTVIVTIFKSEPRQLCLTVQR